MRTTQVAVIGGGPAGLSAAIAAARAGAATTLIDEQPTLGGQLRYRLRPTPLGDREGERGPDLARSLAAEAGAAGVALLTGATAWGLFEGNVLGVADGASAFQIRPEAIVLATGSTDLPFPFAGGSLPGVFSARAVQILLHVHRVRPGRRFVVLGAGPVAAEVAEDIRFAGGEIVARVDPDRGEALTAAGAGGVQTVTVGGDPHEADIVVVAIGRQPDVALAQMAGCELAFAPDLGGHAPVRDERLRTSVRAILVAGDVAGVCDASTAAAEGRYAGLSAAATLGLVDDATLSAERAAYEATGEDRIARASALTPTFAQAYR